MTTTIRKKKDIIRSVPDGGTLALPLSEESYRAWVQRSREVNAEDGWEHYLISINKRLNTLTIIANTP